MEQGQKLRKIEAARLSVITTLALTIIKLTAGLLVNSLAIISSSMDSFLDLFSSSINYFSIKKAEEPADKSHPYGHGKIENLASLFQVMLITITGGSIIYEGIKRLRSDEQILYINLGITIMTLSSLTSFILSNKLSKAADDTESIALATDSLNFKTDAYINLSVIVSLLIFKFTGKTIVDPVMSLCIGAVIIWSAGKLFLRSFEDLTDKELPQKILDEIEKTIQKHSDSFLGYHKLRTRRAGSQKMIDLHLVACRNLHLDEVHGIADRIEKEIEQRVPHSNVIIHTEPCKIVCDNKKYDKNKCRWG